MQEDAAECRRKREGAGALALREPAQRRRGSSCCGGEGRAGTRLPALPLSGDGGAVGPGGPGGPGRAGAGPPSAAVGGADGAGDLAALAGRLLRLLPGGDGAAREGASAQVRPAGPFPNLPRPPWREMGLSCPSRLAQEEEGCSAGRSPAPSPRWRRPEPFAAGRQPRCVKPSPVSPLPN